MIRAILGSPLAAAFLSLLVSFALVGAAHASEADQMKVYAVDVGTGQALWVEWPGGPDGRPWRLLYDTGKEQGQGVENDLAAFLVSEQIGLRPADGDFEGDVIDFFVMSHAHEDHFNGGKPIFDLFDVRNVIESKQISAVRYLKRFKGPAINEILRARERGKDAHFYVVGLPYPNGFDRPVDGEPYDEYEICNSEMPDYIREQVDARRFQGKVRFPFGPDEVAQVIHWPVKKFVGDHPKALEYVEPAYHDAVIDVEALPVGTHFQLTPDSAFTILHADTIAAFDFDDHDRRTYQRGWPYYREFDLNDTSVTVQVFFKNSRVLIPGDTEGRDGKPDEFVTLPELFGTGEGRDAYTRQDLETYLRREKPVEEQLPLLPDFERYLMGNRDLIELGYLTYVTLDYLTPRKFEMKLGGTPFEVAARDYVSPSDIPDAAVRLEDRDEAQRGVLHEGWKRRLFKLYQDLGINRQKFTGLRTRFKGWNRGAKLRMHHDRELDRFLLDWKDKVWTVTNLVQLTERIYYVDPALANILAGMILRSDLFLDYVAPKEKRDWTGRGEKHMIHVADRIMEESGFDVLRSDVLVFGHHGSFTSSSLGFILRVNPNVGIISADDKSYAGSTLPDFSALFWNMNSHHPQARSILHSLFFHADMLAFERGEPVDGYAWRNRYSQSAARVFRRRRRWPIPIWRTDFNDDLENVNTLMDNILIATDGSEPIWDWARHRKKGEEGYGRDALPEDAAEFPARYQYWSQELITAHPPGSEPIRPHDPSGVMRSFATGDRLDANMRVTRSFSLLGVLDDEELDIWEQDWNAGDRLLNEED